jgi:AcrR family transcriptional regulator
MENRKKLILEAARALFNEKGYDQVTIRMIALKMSISSGNLSYHYKKREDILEALYFEMVVEFDERIVQLDKKKITLKTIKEDVLVSLQRMVDYHFFWTDLYNLLRLNEKIKSHFEEVYKNRFDGSQFLFNALIEMGKMKHFEFKKESHFLIERMIGLSNTWLYNSFLYGKEINEDYIELQSDNFLLMLYPYLTDLGKNEYKDLAIGD